MKTILPVLIGCVLFISCSKDSNDSSSGTTVKYEVITNGSNMSTIYTNENKQTVGGYGASGWTYQFKVADKPFTASLEAAATGSPVSVTVNIYVNGSKVATNSSSGVSATDTQTQYVIN